MKTAKGLRWIKDIIAPDTRRWEEFYRNRWQHDKVVRSTHGVNCTGGCSWGIYVKDGIVTWELQQLDYPLLENGIPPYEPRGCQRGISFSWYLYSPIRVKYPYIRGALLDQWKVFRQQHSDPVDAWAALQADPAARERVQRARGKGGFRRASWNTVLEIMAAANVYTARKWGPDRVIGFSPIPAMSFLSYGGGSRFLQLFGGVNLSFYDWYCDLPPASPEAWGEQTDVQESADWYNAKFLAVMGSNLNMTRTPDCHFAAESRYNGTKMVVFAPDFNQVAKYADEWVPIHAGQDGAFWMAANHVILTEFHHQRKVDYFHKYQKQFTDSPMLVELHRDGDRFRAGRYLRANRLAPYTGAEKGEWKFLQWDETTDGPKMAKGSMGFRWAEDEQNLGKWNLTHTDGEDGAAYEPRLSFLEHNDGIQQVAFDDFGEKTTRWRGVPVRTIKDADGNDVTVTTVFDLLMAQFGVNRGLAGEYPADYDDENAPFTPAWSEKWTGINRKDVIRFARQWAGTAEATNGKCTIILGAGINHWYHNNLIYRAGICALMFCGCVGVNGGGLAHYVGQEKLAPMASWSTLAFAKDWQGGQRLQNAPSWHYVHTDQWRYERHFDEYAALPEDRKPHTKGHTIDIQSKAVRLGWLPCYPQFNKNSIELVKEAEAAGCKTDPEIVNWVVQQLKDDKLKFAMDDPDAPECWPRVWYIWRGNALMSSMKGHEYMLNHYLGTHHNDVRAEVAKEHIADHIVWRDAVKGKFDLVVDINFRMDTSALYSDIVLPAATFYEKADLNSTDLHSFIHPLSEAVPPAWESKSDWQAFGAIAEATSKLAGKHLPGKIREIHISPLAHDCPDELAQSEIKDWKAGECEAIPGKTMPHIRIVERDYENLHNRFSCLGPKIREGKIGAHGVSFHAGDVYEQMLEATPTRVFDGQVYPSVREDENAANVILMLAPETNGELAFRGYEEMEKKVGLTLTDLAEGNRKHRVSYKDLQSQPRRLLNSPCWSGLLTDGRAYSPFTYNVERLVPWRTVTGRQQLYLDHEGYLEYGEHLPTYKPSPPPDLYGDMDHTQAENSLKPLNYLTPHGKWHIHSTYGDTERMMTLSRGCEPFWINDRDAAEIGLQDNDWVEVYNDNGVVVVRCNVSARIPRGACIIYHSPERTLGVPKSPLRNMRRGGGHNSLTRCRLKPLLMFGGYGQFTFHFNYWGPTGVNRDTHVYVRKLPKLVW